jgi:CHAD domain-containing protein
MIATSGRFAIGSNGVRRLGDVLAADRRELLALLPELRRVRPDDIHRARVLARRMRALLRAYSPAFERARARHARRVLKSFARTLDDCREADVREALFLDVAGAGDGPRVPVPDELVERLARARIDAGRTAARRLGRPGLARDLRDALAGLQVDDGLPVGWMLGRLDRRARRLHRRIRHDREGDGLHRLRLAVKSLRYALAPLEDIAPVAGRRLHARLREAQDWLGDQHDVAQALAWAEGDRQAHCTVGRPLRRALRKRERASTRAARSAVRKIGPAWRQWRTAAGDVTAAL